MEGGGEAGKPDPGSTGTVAAEDGGPDPIPDPAKPDLNRFSFVRTRQSLAEIINAGKEPDVEMAEKGGRKAMIRTGSIRSWTEPWKARAVAIKNMMREFWMRITK
jgi:hypothetical protein